MSKVVPRHGMGCRNVLFRLQSSLAEPAVPLKHQPLHTLIADLSTRVRCRVQIDILKHVVVLARQRKHVGRLGAHERVRPLLLLGAGLVRRYYRRWALGRRRRSMVLLLLLLMLERRSADSGRVLRRGRRRTRVNGPLLLLCLLWRLLRRRRWSLRHRLGGGSRWFRLGFISGGGGRCGSTSRDMVGSVELIKVELGLRVVAPEQRKRAATSNKLALRIT